MEHFRDLAEAWSGSRRRPRRGSRSSPASARRSSRAPTSRRTSREITKLPEARSPRRAVTEIDGYRLDDGTRAVLRNWPLYKPIIAAVNGFCTAGGMEMLGGFDIRVACPKRKFAVMEPKRGLFAGGGTTVRLPRQIPLAAGDGVPAVRRPHLRADARLEMGLLNAIVPRDELLDAAVRVGRAGSPPTRRSRCRRRRRACCEGLATSRSTTPTSIEKRAQPA